MKQSSRLVLPADWLMIEQLTKMTIEETIDYITKKNLLKWRNQAHYRNWGAKGYILEVTTSMLWPTEVILKTRELGMEKEIRLPKEKVIKKVTGSSLAECLRKIKKVVDNGVTIE